MFDDEHSVFICLQEIIGNNVQSIQVRRDGLQSFFFPSASIHFPQEIKHSSKCGLDVSVVSLTILCLYILICILKRSGRWKVRGRWRVSFFLHKYYLRRRKGGFWRGITGFDLIFLIKKTVWVKKEPFVSDLFFFAFMCLESECY